MFASCGQGHLHRRVAGRAGSRIWLFRKAFRFSCVSANAVGAGAKTR
jgi:hypothetical protein